mgnify:FL=1
MNKKILKLVFASAFALVAGYSVYASQQKVEMSDLAMANVEALAGGESGTVKCCPDPGDECKLSSGDILEGQDEC